MNEFTPKEALAEFMAGRDLPPGAYVTGATEKDLLALRQAREFWVSPSESNELGDPPEPNAYPVHPG